MPRAREVPGIWKQSRRRCGGRSQESGGNPENFGTIPRVVSGVCGGTGEGEAVQGAIPEAVPDIWGRSQGRSGAGLGLPAGDAEEDPGAVPRCASGAGAGSPGRCQGRSRGGADRDRGAGAGVGAATEPGAWRAWAPQNRALVPLPSRPLAWSSRCPAGSGAAAGAGTGQRGRGEALGGTGEHCVVGVVAVEGCWDAERGTGKH